MKDMFSRWHFAYYDGMFAFGLACLATVAQNFMGRWPWTFFLVCGLTLIWVAFEACLCDMLDEFMDQWKALAKSTD